MKRKIGALLLSGAMTLSLCACTSNPADPSASSSADSGTQPLLAVEYPKSLSFDDHEGRSALREENPVSQETIHAINRFSYETAASLLQGKKSENYSPVSLYFALALCSTGAQNETQQELLQVLGGMDAETLAKECSNLYRVMNTDNEITKLKLNNSVWLNEGVSCKEGFLNTAASKFYSEVYQLDFADEEAGKTMGKWIADHTNGTLSPELEVDPQQLLHLINTVYFCDQWVDQFDAGKTSAGVFQGTEGEEMIDFMNRTDGSHGFAKGENFVRSSLGLKGGNTMTFVLPTGDHSVEEFLESPEALQAVLTEGNEASGEVTWKIPKFAIEAKYNCKDMLKRLGVTSAFSQIADFSGITDSLAFLDSVVQETYLSVNENGVEASAFTDIAYAGAAMPTDKAEMILDRPFLYAVQNREGAMLFIGVYQGGAGEQILLAD